MSRALVTTMHSRTGGSLTRSTGFRRDTVISTLAAGRTALFKGRFPSKVDRRRVHCLKFMHSRAPEFAPTFREILAVATALDLAAGAPKEVFQVFPAAALAPVRATEEVVENEAHQLNPAAGLA